MRTLGVAVTSIVVGLAVAADPTAVSDANPAPVRLAKYADTTENPASSFSPLSSPTAVPATSFLLVSGSSRSSDPDTLQTTPQQLDDTSDTTVPHNPQRRAPHDLDTTESPPDWKKPSLATDSATNHPLMASTATVNSLTAPMTTNLPIATSGSGADASQMAAPIIPTTPSTVQLQHLRTVAPEDPNSAVPISRGAQVDRAAPIVADPPLKKAAAQAIPTALPAATFVIVPTPASIADAALTQRSQTAAPQVYPPAAPPLYTPNAIARVRTTNTPPSTTATVQSPTSAPVTTNIPIAITPSDTNSNTDAPQTSAPTINATPDTSATQNPQTTVPHDPSATAPPSTAATHDPNATAPHDPNATAPPSNATAPPSNTTQPAATPTPHVNDIQPAPTSSTSGSNTFAGSSSGSSSAQSASASDETGSASGSKKSASKTKSGASRTTTAAATSAVAIIASLAIAAVFA